MKNRSKKTGFSLVELLTAVAVLSILVGISSVAYISSIDRTRIISTKANMHVLQTTVETYAMYNNGIYPDSLATLKTEAKVEGYWKNLRNPLSLQIDPITDLTLTTTVPAGGVGYRAGSEDPFLIGTALTFVKRYAALAVATDTTTGSTNSITSYSIVGADPNGNIIAKGDGNIFVLTNGNYTPASAAPSSTTPSVQPVASPTVDPYNPDNYTQNDSDENDKNKKNEDDRYKNEEKKEEKQEAKEEKQEAKEEKNA